MIFCKKCKKALHDDSLFCTGCGHSLKRNWLTNWIIENGRKIALSAVGKKAAAIVLSITVSIAGTLFFVRRTFKDEFRDYYYYTYMDLHEETMLLIDHLSKAVEMDPQRVKNYFEIHNIYERSEKLYRDAVGYYSNNKDINLLHNRTIDFCEEVYDVANHLSVTAYYEENILGSGTYLRVQSLAAKNKILNETKNKVCEKYGIKMNELGVVE